LDAFPFLETTAEISATFAGFISIFVVLAQRDGSFDPGVALLIRLVLISSVFCLFFAALPVILAVLSVPSAFLWQLSSTAMLTGGAGVSAYVLRNRQFIEPSVLVPLAYVLNTAAFLSLISNVAGWPAAPNGGAYLAAVWLILGIASLNFIDLVFHRLLKPPAA